MITRSEVKLHVKFFSEGVEKAGDKFGAMVGSDMFWNTVFGEHVHNKQHCKVFRSAVDGCQNNMPCLESRSTITRIESQPEDVGKVSMKSIEMEFHGCSGTRSCFSKL